MNVNGSKFHLFLGAEDWGRCDVVYASGSRASLAKGWAARDSLAEKSIQVPRWDKREQKLTLAQEPVVLPKTIGETEFRNADRRGVAADRNGNIYVIAKDADQNRIEVQSSGTGTMSTFWYGEPSALAKAGLFTPIDPVTANPPALKGLAITSNDYLIAVSDYGFLRFDLVGGGAHEEWLFPPELAIEQTENAKNIDPLLDIAPAACGSLWLLHGSKSRLYAITADLSFAVTESPVERDADFQPMDGGGKRTTATGQVTPIDLANAAGDATPIALAALSDGNVLVLCHNEKAKTSRLLIVMAKGSKVGRIQTLLEDKSNKPGKPPKPAKIIDLPDLAFSAFCIAVGPGEVEEDFSVYLANTNSNQAHRIGLTLTDGQLIAHADPVIIPLRRFGGRGFVLSGKHILYDCGSTNPVWVPALAQKRQKFATYNRIATPALDSGEPQCTWDRLRIDGCIPTGTSILVEARAADDIKMLEGRSDMGWVVQPRPYLNSDGGELPGKSRLAMAQSDTKLGRGSWDLLLQDMVGRFLELRITLTGDGRFTPHLRAMRVWYPRFSWSARFLPGAYREEPVSASFLERFLANMEGVSSVVEDRIAAAQHLFDTRTAPVEALDWLAEWYDVALDPHWDEKRRRLFIRYAPLFFNWRGTIKGLRLALQIAFNIGVDDDAFQLDAPEHLQHDSVRIVENYMNRPRPRKLAAQTLASGILFATNDDTPWMPAEGAQGLSRRWSMVVEPDMLPAASSNKLALYLDAGNRAVFAAFLQKHLGFVPDAGAQERKRWLAFQQSTHPEELPQIQVPDGIATKWQAFLALPARDRKLWQNYLRERYRRIARFNATWQTQWTDFAEIPLPDQVPPTEKAIRDWLIFEGQILPMDRAAHRFTVLLPRLNVDFSGTQEAQDIRLANRIIALEKPAHTVFDVRFHWAMNRVGEARLGSDTHIGQGSRAPELVPPAILGQAYIGVNFVGGPTGNPNGRERLAC